MERRPHKKNSTQLRKNPQKSWKPQKKTRNLAIRNYEFRSVQFKLSVPRDPMLRPFLIMVDATISEGNIGRSPTPVSDDLTKTFI